MDNWANTFGGRLPTLEELRNHISKGIEVKWDELNDQIKKVLT